MNVIVNRISVASLEELLISPYNQDFNEVAHQKKTELSIEDKRFLEIARGAVQVDGNYSLKLPFREANVSLPNSCQIAEQRLTELKEENEQRPAVQAGICCVHE